MIIVIIIQNSIYNDLACNGQHRQAEYYNGMTCMELWYWLISHGVSRHDMDTEFLLYLYKQKNSQTNEERLRWMVAKSNLSQ